MTFLRKLDNGDYYICRRAGKKVRFGRIKHYSKFLDWFRSYASNKHGQVVDLRRVDIPKELFGKRLRFKVEVVNVYEADQK